MLYICKSFLSIFFMIVKIEIALSKKVERKRWQLKKMCLRGFEPLLN